MSEQTKLVQAPSAHSAGAEASRLYHQGRNAEAERICHEQLRRDPRDAGAAHLLGLVLLKKGNREQALGMLDRAATLAPHNATFNSNFGGVLFEAGHVVEAERYLARAIELQPNFADAQCNMGNVLRFKGDLAGAEAAYRKALALEPRMAAGHNNLGLIFYMLGRKVEAVASYREAIALNPAFAEAHNNLGNALCDLEQDDEGIANLTRAIALSPTFAEAHTNLAKVLLRKENLPLARAHLMQSLAIQPDMAGTYHNLGSLLRIEGAFAEAEGCFRKAVALDPSQFTAYASMTGTRKMLPSDRPLIAKLEQIARDGKARADSETVYVEFALGKAYDDLGEYASAFEHYRIGNDMVRDRLSRRFDRGHFEAHIDGMIERFTPEFFARHRNDGNPSELPVLILGMMRSGTSLVEQILSSHPQIHGAGEQMFWAVEDRRMRTDLQDPAPGALADTSSRYLAHLRTFSATAMRVTDKMPHNFLHLGLIHMAFPNARIIHCCRDPVDTCLSIYFQNFPALHPYAYDLEDLAVLCEQYERFMQHWRKVIPPAQLLQVQYEDLVADQEGGSRRMIEFCGLDWDDRCLAFQENRRIVRTASSWQVRQPLYRTSVARWQKYEPYLGPLARLRKPPGAT